MLSHRLPPVRSGFTLRPVSSPSEIYIRVEGRNGQSWRVVKALRKAEDLFEIVSDAPPPPGETWQFAPGDTVRCKPYELTDHDVVLVACEKV